MEGYDLDAMHGSGGGGSRKRARADAAQRTDRDLDALHRTGEREASSAQRSGKRKKKGNARERGFAKRAARDQRKRIEELNANRDQPKRRSKAERARSRASPRTLPFERCFWRDLPAPAPTWRQQISGSAAREAALKATRKALAVVVKGDCPPPIASAADPHLCMGPQEDCGCVVQPGGAPWDKTEERLAYGIVMSDESPNGVLIMRRVDTGEVEVPGQVTH